MYLTAGFTREKREKWEVSKDQRDNTEWSRFCTDPVSYTHLTLPTIYSV